MKRAVLDTEVWVQGLAFAGPARKAIRTGLEGRVGLACSPPLLLELELVLIGQEFALRPDGVGRVFDEINHLAVIVHPVRKLRVVRKDPDADRLLECAMEWRADYAVTFHPSLLSLKSFKGVDLLTPRQFLAAVDF